MSTNGTSYGDYAPIVTGNEISFNTGPGVDIYNVWGGTFESNNVHDNTSWAGFSLLGSNWSVKNNTVIHPSTYSGQPYIASCSTGPMGSHSAAIFLCQGTVAAGVKTAQNTISGNTVSSYYGILLIGNDEANSLAVPNNNTVGGRTPPYPVNNFLSNVLECADDFKRSGPNANSWTGSGCKPKYF